MRCRRRSRSRYAGRRSSISSGIAIPVSCSRGFFYPQDCRFFHKTGCRELRTRFAPHYDRRSMTKKEAKRRLEDLALETGHKRNHYVKRALVEFLDLNEHLLAGRPTRTNGLSTLDNVPSRLTRFTS
jgi:hypothetical protein